MRRFHVCLIFFFQAEYGIRDLVRSRGLGDVYKRQVGDIALLGVGVLGWPQPANPSGSGWRIALASVGPTPLMAPEAAALLAENTDDEAVEAAAAAVMNASRPIDDVRASGAYRQAMVRVLARRAIEDVLARLPM